MKKLLFAATVLAVALRGFAQGYVYFNNGGNPPQTSIFYQGYPNPYPGVLVHVGPNNLPGGGTLVVGLFWGTSSSNVTTLAATSGINSPGIFGSGNPLAVTGTNPGDTDWFAVTAWDSTYGNTYAGEEACRLAGGAWGSTGVGSFTLGTSSVATFLFQQLEFPNEGFSGFYLNVSPEPSTIALTCLGATALLLLRRRKATTGSL